MLRVDANRQGAHGLNEQLFKRMSTLARGVLSGVIWGTVVAAVGAGGLSIAAGPPGAARIDAIATPTNTMSQADTDANTDVDAAAKPDQPRIDQEAEMPTTQALVKTTNSGQMPELIEQNSATIGGVDTSSAAVPQAGGAQSGLNTPMTTGDTGNVMVGGDAPVLPNPQSMAPSAPTTEAELSISTDPAQPNAPIAQENSAFAQADAPNDAGSSPTVQSVSPIVPVVPMVTSQGKTVDETKDDAMADLEIKVTEGIVITPQIEKSNSQGSDELVIIVKPETAPDATPEMDPVQSAESGDAPAPAPKPMIKTDNTLSARIGKPAGGLDKFSSGIATNRLPSLAGTNAAQVADGADKMAAKDTSETVENRTALPPIERFAVAFEGVDNKPKMSIVLIDDGSSKIGVEALTSFPYPLSFAVDASWDGARDAMDMYRAAGFEVLAMVDLADGSRASDVEVAMPVVLEKLPEVIGVMEGATSGVQGSRVVSDQLTEILSSTGHGLLLFPKGLNTAQKLAAKAGVRSNTVFRDFDSKGQKESTIRRFLNHAVLKAGNEGGVVMVGRLRADTVSALLLWGLQEKASRVSLAPISTLLQAQK